MKKLLTALAALAAAALLFSCEKEKVIELSVSPVAVNFNVEGGNQAVTVSCNDNWTATAAADWITLSPSAGEGNGSLGISVADNTSFDARESSVTVKAGNLTQTVKVGQLGLAPDMKVAPETIDAAPAGESVTVSITANVDWQVSIPESITWITADVTSGSKDGTVNLTIAPNASLETRSAAVAINGAMNLSKSITITQGKTTDPRQTDSLALVKLFNAADGENWTKDKWDLTASMDNWKGIKLENGRVIELKLTVSGVVASEWTLPEEIGHLTELKDFRINSNKVTGNIPEALYSLTKLENLYLQNNNITGSLSDKLGQLKELKQLYIDRNANMTGGIPAQIGQLTKLERINISQSGIGGSVPAEIGQCVALLQFMAFKTNLTGALPDVWDLPQLQTVMMHTNPGLTGELPASLGKLKPLASGTAPSIQLYGCNFTGNIPESFATLPDATKQVHIYENKMSGEVPATVVAHPNFESWRINPQQEGYGLTVTPPLTPRQLDSLVLVKIYEITDGATWKESRRWDLSKPLNDWPGIKLNDEGRVTELNLTNGTVTGKDWEIPEVLAELTELTSFQAIGSRLTGQIPEFLYNMTKLTNIRLNTNPNLAGTLSTKLGQLTELTDLYINGTGISGPLPATIGNLKNLKNINIAQTKIGGAIPQELTGCTSLANFMAYDCQLSGEVPDFWDKFDNIGIIQLYNNPGLTGSLPASCGRASTTAKTYSLRFDGCNFTGNIPESYATLPSQCKQFYVKNNKLSGVVPAGVQAHANWGNWKAADNILPQQEGYGLTLE